MADSLRLGGHRLVPLACGALFWPAEGLLAVADLHLEKASAFARSGWMLPPHDSRDTLARLAGAIARTGARRVLVLGDSFHDPDGPQRLPTAERGALVAMVGALDWTWIAGNHDGVAGGGLGGVVADEIVIGGIAFRHIADPAGAGPEVSGHLHPKAHVPGVPGPARRCFALAGERLVLPAYGSLAGGLDIGSAAFAAALGQAPVGLLPTVRGLARVDCRNRAA